MSDQTVILAGGCFWCTEAVFLQLSGVASVESGYIGGHVANPTYKQVCSGATGHAEAIRIRFDCEVIALGDLLDVFFATHDPTQLNRQGNDVGTQYRSAIFPLDEAQAEVARNAIGRANAENGGRVVTTIEPAATWWPAEDYHQDYWASEGLKLMQKGGSYKLCIPAALGYGDKATGPIPANSPLIFTVDLLDFKSMAEIQAMQAQMPQAGAGAPPHGEMPAGH